MPMPPPGSRRWRWSSCRASPAPSRWTSSPRQSNLAGYKAVLDAAAEYGRAFPMMMTAAGTIAAARVFVMGVGVAGLQAIATARRLGAHRLGDRRPRRRPRSRSRASAPRRSSSRRSPASRARAPAATRPRCRDEYKAGAGRARLRPYRQAGHRHHHRADPGPAGAAADLGRPARDDAAGQRRRRPRGRAGRQCRGRGRRARWSSATASASSATATCRAASPPTPRRSTPATSTISSAPSGTPRRGGWCCPTTTRSCKGVRLTQGGKVVNERLLG